MMVVLLETDFKLGEKIEKMLLSTVDDEFRSGLRALQRMWQEEVERVEKACEEPLKLKIEELVDECKVVVMELGLTADAKALAENRIVECESDLKMLESKNNNLTAEVDTLREKSDYCDDVERSRSEISMIAELQKIENDSRTSSLNLELSNLKRSAKDGVVECERKVGLGHV